VNTPLQYRLEFLPSAEKEWRKPGAGIRLQFARKLEGRLANPHVASARLFDMPDCYKIKLRSVGYRLVYRVFDDRIVVQVVAVGKRERNQVYKIAAGRLA
jgi:mRNA interferase RelE/StbE